MMSLAIKALKSAIDHHGTEPREQRAPQPRASGVNFDDLIRSTA
jgi:hypothetical protein